MFSPIRVLFHKYWLRRDRFLLNSDSYPLWTIFAVERGIFIYRIGEFKGEATTGDLVICPPNTTFERKIIDDLTFHFIQIAPFEGDQSMLDHSHPFINEAKLSVPPHNRERMRSTFQLMERAARLNFDQANLAVQQHLINDLWLLASNWDIDIENGLRSRKAVLDKTMKTAKEALLQKAFDNIPISQLAAELGLTSVQLTRRFRAAFGITPIEYVTQARMEKACKLLEETSLTLDQIAPVCGYENGFYLSRTFHSKIGVTPSEYRSSHRV
ncbi:AraC-like DNA-binding protein [Paenibacillus sp. BK033]|uniref:AraC family transcriptional regulator n=1 Tax=Paenibacillus sp. BK033 TaxID=2512133 RepID=UPI001044B7F2|nr:helix-turn-helix domain-containing protein [Paenibacillus sp. BK033]TCM89760.1 AraC-like DNA-binding protein [Paenibacillus sp. BK033]